jgi:hypothetical protein
MSPTQDLFGRARHRRAGLWFIGLAISCAGLLPVIAQTAGESPQKHPDVVAVTVRAAGPGRFDFDVTVSSPYDTPRRYADALRVTGKDAAVYGERKLLHDHADEQPFTRDLHGVVVPAGVRVVVVQARDSRFGYGGKTAEVVLPARN